MKIVIWGLGIRGKRLFSKLREEEVVAFIDNNPTLTGTFYKKKPVISYEQYKAFYRQYYIVVTPVEVTSINQQLKQDGIIQYGNLSECPAELQGVNDISCLDRYLRTFDTSKNYQIKGENFYSIYVASRLIETGVSNICMGGANTWQQLIEIYFPDIKIEKNVKYHTDVLLNASGEKFDTDDPKLTVTDIFDLIGKIKEYRCERLEAFHNIHEGEKCVIVATGPSLLMDDLQRIKASGIKTLSMNKIFLAFDQTDWRPDYYVAADSDIIRENETWIKSSTLPYLLISDQDPGFWKDGETERLYRYHLQQTNPKEDVTFSTNMVDGVYGSGSITFVCIQIAVYMGFSEIYLLGADHTIPGTVEKDHFVDNYEKKRNIDYFAYHNLAEAEYHVAKKYADTNHIHIYNATRGGTLEVFERKNIDIILHREGDENELIYK